jgi:hypothetical protein
MNKTHRRTFTVVINAPLSTPTALTGSYKNTMHAYNVEELRAGVYVFDVDAEMKSRPPTTWDVLRRIEVNLLEARRSRQWTLDNMVVRCH